MKSSGLRPHQPPQKAKRNKKLNAYLLLGEERYKPRKSRENIDLDQIKAMGAIGCTNIEMAALLRTSVEYVQEMIAENPEFCQALEEGRANMRKSLRRAQLDMALNGSVPMLIWLGKQYLSQTDKQSIENKTEITVTVQRAIDELRNIPREQLLEAHAMLSAPMIEHEAAQGPEENPGENPEIETPHPLM